VYEGRETEEKTGEDWHLRGRARTGYPHRQAVWLNALHREAVSFNGLYVGYALRSSLDLVPDGHAQPPVFIGQLGAVDPGLALAADIHEDTFGRDLDDTPLHDLAASRAGPVSWPANSVAKFSDGSFPS
jgi:hypothetical protein